MLLAGGSLSAQTFTKHIPDPNGGFGNNIVSNLVVRNNDVVGFTSGANTLFYFNNGSFTIKAKSLGFYNYNDGDKGRELDVDTNGDMWLVHASTVDQYDNSSITNWNSSSTDLPDNNVKDMAIDNNGKIYFGTGSDGVSTYNSGTWTHYPNYSGGLSDLNTIPFPDFLEADPVNNDIFLAELSNVHLIHDNNTMTSFDNSNFFGSFNTDFITCMTATQDGKIWFGIESFSNDPATSGIFMYDGTSWTHYNTNNSNIPVNSITAMTSVQNNIYFAGQSVMGIHEFDGSNVTTYDSLNSTHNNPSIFSSYVNDMVYHNNKLYLAQQDGLVEFDFPGGNGPSSVNEDELNTITVYPNPAENNITIQSGVTVENVEIYSLSGLKVMDEHSNQIDISNLKAGLYIVKVKTADGKIKHQKIHKK